MGLSINLNLKSKKHLNKRCYTIVFQRLEGCPDKTEVACSSHVTSSKQKAGLWIGFLFLMVLDRVVPHLHMHSEQCEGPQCALQRSTMMILAVALHNLPEGMAVGVVAAGWLRGNESISAASALALSLGIALQNLPEGAIISMPLKSGGMGRGKAFGYGVLSGVVEPVGAVLTILLSQVMVPILPYLLAFSAGVIPENRAASLSELTRVFDWKNVKKDDIRLAYIPE